MKTYTDQQITSGLELAAQWYEGWKVDDLGADQLLECTDKAEAGAAAPSEGAGEKE